MFKEHAGHNAANIIWMKRFRLSSEQVLCRFSDQPPILLNTRAVCQTPSWYAIVLFLFDIMFAWVSHVFRTFRTTVVARENNFARERLFAKNVPVLTIGFGFFVDPALRPQKPPTVCEVRGGTCSKFATNGVIKRINMYSCSSIDPWRGRAVQQCHKKNVANSKMQFFVRRTPTRNVNL